MSISLILIIILTITVVCFFSTRSYTATKLSAADVAQFKMECRSWIEKNSDNIVLLNDSKILVFHHGKTNFGLTSDECQTKIKAASKVLCCHPEDLLVQANELFIGAEAQKACRATHARELLEQGRVIMSANTKHFCPNHRGMMFGSCFGRYLVTMTIPF